MDKVKCTHCHLEYDKEVMIIEKEGDREIYFCCKGCQGIYHLLKSDGLDSFYEKLGDEKLAPPPENSNDDLEKFDLEGFKKKYIKINEEGFSEVSLIIEGIHCSACVWLNEKILHQTEGIVEASINYTNNKAKVVWDEETIKLSSIIEKIRSIGYNAYPYDPKIQEEKANKSRRDYYSRLLVAIFATMNIMWIAIALYTGYFTGMTRETKNVLNFAEFILATPTLFYTGWVYFKGAYYGLKNRFINMDFLVVTGASLAYLYSIYSMIFEVGEVYFDSVTMIITFVFVGKYLEVLSKKRAVDTLDSISSTIPTEVTQIVGKEKILTPIEEIKEGDIIEVRAGEKIVIDGIIIEGEGSFDESSLTGEATPIYKRVGDEIISGSISLDSVIRYRATKEFLNSTLSTIITILEESITKKPKIEKLANRISGYFSLAILILALITFIVWLSIGTFENAIVVAISVIVIACPCALGLATPVATLVGLGVGAKRGILFKEASFLETIAKSNIIVLDKTGTITEGKPKVINQKILKEFDKNLLYSLIKSSNHPISKAIQEFLSNENLKEYHLENIKNREAKGIEAFYQKRKIFGGNLKLIREEGIDFNIESENSIFIFAIDDEVVAYFELKDRLKENTKKTILELKKLNYQIVMLTGDNQKVASKIAKESGIEEFYHSLYPKDKADFIDELHKREKIVIMAGDGINDSIALSKSDVAIAMGSGADIAIEVSDVIFLDDKIENLLTTIRLSKRVFKIVKENIGLSIIYNGITIPLAMMGYVIPLIAALSMSISSIIVVTNSMRIRGFN